MTEKLNQFLKQKYINVETYRKNGEPVRTTVWFVIDGELIYVITRETTGKVKRIKNNENVKVVPSTFGGKPTGRWVSGKASFVDGEDAKKAIDLRNKKYGFMAKLAGAFTSGKGNLVVFSIKLD